MENTANNPWGPWGSGKKIQKNNPVVVWNHWRAQVLASLRKSALSLPPRTLALPVPQDACCFSFGSQKTPLPAGALLRIWSEDPDAIGECPHCQGEVVVTAFGGLMSTGGYQGLCLKCATTLFQWIGGLGAVHHHVSPFLEGTPWYVNGARFGGAVASDGKALVEALGLREPPKGKRPPVVTLKVGRVAVPAMKVDVFEER